MLRRMLSWRYTCDMPPTAAPVRPFKPGTTGWTVQDLDDPRIARKWFRGRYEIVEGVLTTMPPAYFAGGNGLFNLLHRVKNHMEQHQLSGRFATEVDLVVDEVRVAIPLRTKRKWYAEFRVPNYWTLDAFTRGVECLVLGEQGYRTSASGLPRSFSSCAIVCSRALSPMRDAGKITCGSDTRLA